MVLLLHIPTGSYPMDREEKIFGLSKERLMVIDNLNLNLSQISSFTHIYGFADFNRFVDFRI